MTEQSTVGGAVQAPAGPAPGSVWDVDPAHTTVEFVVRHLMSKVRGRFGTFTGEVTFGESSEESSVTATVDTSSIDTNQGYRDTHLRSPDFFHAEEHPQMRFVSTKITRKDAENYVVSGDLTIRETTKPVELEVEHLGVLNGPFGARIGFSATGEIDRYDFGLTYNQALEGGSLLVSRKVMIEVNGQLAERKAEAAAQ